MHFHKLLAEGLKDAALHSILRQLFVLRLVVVDVLRCVKVGDYLPLQPHILRERIIVKSLHLPEGALEDIKILSLGGDIFMSDALQSPQCLEGLLKRSSIGPVKGAGR